MLSNFIGGYYKFYRLFYSYFSLVTLVFLLVYQYMGDSYYLFTSGWMLHVVAIPVVITGAIIMCACIIKYFPTVGGVDVLMKKPKPPVLELEGLHKYVRHPLYLGTLLFIWALFLIFPLLSNLIACIIITLYVLIGIRFEERKLYLEFGDDYKNYARKTPMLIPSLKFGSQKMR